MKTFYSLFSLLLITFSIKAQTDAFLTNEEKAYMYHIVMKSPTLNHNMEYIFTYTGPYAKKDSADYLLVENEIIREPSILNVDLEEFKNLSSGVVGELSVKMALWTLYNELKKGTLGKEKIDSTSIYFDFIDSLVKKVPESVTYLKKKTRILSKSIYPLLNPNLTYNRRKELIHKIKGLDVNDEKKLMNAISETIKEYTQKKSKDVYKMLGMNDELNTNFLLAAGDGSGTAGLLGEKETDNIDNEGKAKGVGLFTYQTDIITEGDKQIMYPSKEPNAVVYSIGKNKQTNLHLSVWGYNYSTQTTVVVSKGDKSYLLYGSKNSGELSPNPKHNNDEKTYKTHLTTLTETDIPLWENEVFGEDGFEEKLKQHIIDKDELLLAIQKNEYKLSMYRMDQKKNRKKIKKMGDVLNKQHDLLAKINKKINEADEKFFEGKVKLDGMKQRARTMRTNLGDFNQIPHRINHLEYEFEDGTIFNIKSQDLIFKADKEEQEINIKLLAVGSKPMSFYADEVQMNISVTEVNNTKIEIENVALYLNDAFKSDRFSLNELTFSKEAEYLFEKIIEHSIEKDINLKINLKGEGIGEKKGNNINTVKDQYNAQLKKYPGETSAERKTNIDKDEFKELRVTQGNFYFSKKELNLEITSFTDPVKSNVFSKSRKLESFHKQHPVVLANSLLSGLRTFALYEKMVKKMVKISDKYLKDDKEKKEKYRKYFKLKLENNPVQLLDFRLEYNVFKKN